MGKEVQWEDLIDPFEDVDFNAVELTEEDLLDFEPEHGCETLEEHLSTQEMLKNIRKLVDKARSYWQYHNHCQEQGIKQQLDYHEWLSMENPAAMVGFEEEGEEDECDH